MTNERLTRIAFCLALGGALFGCRTQTPPQSQPSDRVTCVVDGATYQVGESWPAADGCNTCSCDDHGHMPCTEMACAPAPLDQPPPQDQPPQHQPLLRDPPASPDEVASQDQSPPQVDLPPEAAPPSGTCPPGQIWKVDHCVGKYVPAPPGPPVCRPGETTQADCNSCHCDSRGYWICTAIGCDSRHN